VFGLTKEQRDIKQAAREFAEKEATVSGQTSTSSGEAMESALELSKLSGHMQQIVGDFKL
jgi:hypothetical protein